MIIINDTVAMGDTLATFPVMAELIKKYNEDTYVHWTNSAVGELFPLKYKTMPLSKLPKESNHKVLKVSMHDIVHYGMHGPSYGTSSNTIPLGHWGFSELTRNTVRTEIEYPYNASVPSYDFILSPYVLADKDRAWQSEKWQELVNKLNEEYKGTICVIGSSKIPAEKDLYKIDPYYIGHFYENLKDKTIQYLNGVDYFFDKPLTELAQLLANTKKLFISVDSGPSNLMSAIRRPHLILYNNKVGQGWSSYPEAHLIYQNVKDITVEQVLNKVKEIIA